MSEREIKRVRGAANVLAMQQRLLDKRLLEAREAGASLRTIAAAAKLSVETTRQRIKRASQSRDAQTTATEGDSA